MNFDQAIEKIESAKDYQEISKIIENTCQRDREAVQDYVDARGD